MLMLGAYALNSFAQISEDITITYCGNGKFDKYELCEPDVKDLCPELGMVLNRIVMECNERSCGCLPGRTAMDCGNNVREGAELCDAGIDFCPNLSRIMGLGLECDKKTCLCKPAETLSYCGDGKVQGIEDCEEDSDCGEGKYCNECVCKDLGVEEKALVDVEKKIEEKEQTEEVTETAVNEAFEEAPVEEVLQEEKIGFFKRLWLWIKGLFS